MPLDWRDSPISGQEVSILGANSSRPRRGLNLPAELRAGYITNFAVNSDAFERLTWLKSVLRKVDRLVEYSQVTFGIATVD